MMIFAWALVTVGFVMCGLMAGAIIKDLMERHEMNRIRRKVEKEWLSR